MCMYHNHNMRHGSPLQLFFLTWKVQCHHVNGRKITATQFYFRECKKQIEWGRRNGRLVTVGKVTAFYQAHGHGQPILFSVALSMVPLKLQFVCRVTQLQQFTLLLLIHTKAISSCWGYSSLSLSINWFFARDCLITKIITVSSVN